MRIEPPTNCPSCDSTLQWVKDQLYCKNSECPAKSSKQLEHFAKTLKIKGMGLATIEKLDITDITDIYELSASYMSKQLNSERTAIKLFDEIQRSKTEYLNTVLPAFGIPLVGKSATEKLSTVIDNIFEINVDVCKKAGLGPKITENLINWLDTQFPKYVNLPFNFEFSKDKKTGSNGVVCITGKLKSYPTKAAAKAFLEGLGYTVKDSVTKETTILINESGKETTKTIKAANDGIRVITNIKDLMENN